jgi:hypothetical protein
MGELAAGSNPISQPVPEAQPHRQSGRIPLWLKVAYTLFVVIVVPYYWRTYSPWNFLYFCDIALTVTLIALWTESRFLASLEAIAILLPQTIWIVDYLVTAFGGHLLGLTDYMFNPGIPVFTRALSAFHGWLPLLLIFLLFRLGYDRRAFRVQCIVGVATLLVCFFVAPRPPAPSDHPNFAVNINYVWGMDDHHPQTAMPAGAWLAMLCGICVVGIYTPTHLVLRKVFPVRADGRAR